MKENTVMARFRFVSREVRVDEAILYKTELDIHRAFHAHIRMGT